MHQGKAKQRTLWTKKNKTLWCSLWTVPFLSRFRWLRKLNECIIRSVRCLWIRLYWFACVLSPPPLSPFLPNPSLCGMLRRIPFGYLLDAVDTWLHITDLLCTSRYSVGLACDSIFSPENSHSTSTVFLVAMLMSIVGGVFISFALMALCYRSVVVHKNFTLCLRLVGRTTLQLNGFYYSRFSLAAN